MGFSNVPLQRRSGQLVHFDESYGIAFVFGSEVPYSIIRGILSVVDNYPVNLVGIHHPADPISGDFLHSSRINLGDVVSGTFICSLNLYTIFSFYLPTN